MLDVRRRQFLTLLAGAGGRGARAAAGGQAADRRVPWLRHGFKPSPMCHPVCAAAARTRLDRRAHRDRVSLGGGTARAFYRDCPPSIESPPRFGTSWGWPCVGLVSGFVSGRHTRHKRRHPRPPAENLEQTESQGPDNREAFFNSIDATLPFRDQFCCYAEHRSHPTVW
jgi:hypothetical protein